MYHFGLFIGGHDLHPIPRAILKAGASELKARYDELGMACAVFVLGDGDVRAASVFGAPVNMVITTDEFPGISGLSESAYDVYGAADEIFVIPWTVRDLATELADNDLIAFNTAPNWLEYATEADTIAAEHAAMIRRVMAHRN